MTTTLIIVAGSVVFTAVIAVIVLRQAGVLGPRKKVLATGTPGTALVIGVAPTGTVINEINYVCRFQLRVQLPGAAPYDVEIKDTVPITAMGAIVPGSVLAVRVDPADPARVFIDLAAGLQQSSGVAPGMTGPAVPGVAAIATALHDPAAAASVATGSAADLLRTGQPAQGYLRSFADTGQTPRSLGRPVTPEAPDALDDPLYVLEVELRFGTGASSVIGTVIHRVPRAILPSLRVGMPLQCAVDPGNPTRNFAIRWDAAGSYATSAA